VVEVSYLDHTQAWNDKGHMRLSLVAVDLPISKSHLLLHHPPLFRLTPPAGISGTFRVAPYETPQSPALRPGANPSSVSDYPVPEGAGQKDGDDATKQLVSHLRDTKRPSTPARNLPLRVAFPHFGPSIFLISELTSENQTPVVEIDFQRDKKRGER
jgi:hypothetical protein